ncbi:hypothetical protein JMJ35_007038 [Cladonia borealis]|uniref:Uncharacterized protein n=1 Tax=Cladonia borealis TaxID=184061 RepID=A0AA39QZD9_9LECA|nr:hypothetical protein JMJ35_007038 [Cladonia borealis]
MAAEEKNFHALAFLSNLIAFVLLATLLALGVYVNVKNILVGNISTDGYNVIKLNTTYWNVACTIVGTAVGFLAAVALANQDECITRSQLAGDRGVMALFLRPLTLRRGLDQIAHLHLPPERTLLLILTIAAALTNAAVVALFGVRSTTERIVNPSASYPLAALNGTFFESDQYGSVFAAGSPTFSSEVSQLSGFLYKAAYINGLINRGQYVPFSTPEIPYIPEQGSIGDTVYAGLNTGGVGLNVSSYLQYSGVTDGFDMPAEYGFDKLQARVFGTNISLSCQNATASYTTVGTRVDIGFVTVMAVSKPNGPNITVFNNLQGDLIITSLVIGSAVTVESDTGEPVHTLVIPDFGLQTAFVLECSYDGQEYLANVSIASSVSPLQIEAEALAGPIIGPEVKQRLANMTHNMLSFGGMGGDLARGFIDADYNSDGTNNTNMAGTLETVIEQLGEAYISLLRQQVERSNLYKGNDASSENGSDLQLYVTVLRLGGGQYGWLAILGVLLIGSLWGTVRACGGRTMVGFDAQNNVQLLKSTLHNTGIRDRTRVRYENDFVVLTGGTISKNEPNGSEAKDSTGVAS